MRIHDLKDGLEGAYGGEELREETVQGSLAVLGEVRSGFDELQPIRKQQTITYLRMHQNA